MATLPDPGIDQSLSIDPARARGGCPHCHGEGGIWVMGVEYIVLRVPCSCPAGDHLRPQPSPDIFSLIGGMLGRLRVRSH